MTILPSYQRVAELAAEYSLVPVYTILDEAVREPTEVFRVLKRLSRQAYILESLEETGDRGRYTFLGYDPQLEITCHNSVVRLKAGTTLEFEGDPGEQIERVMAENRSPYLAELPPFTGGLVGYFAYDYIKYAEPSLELTARDEEGFRDVDLMLFDKVIAYDHLEHRLYLIANVRSDALQENYAKAVSELEYLAAVISTGEPAELPGLQLKSDFSAMVDEAGYCAMVTRAQHHIHEGDIFQVVLSNRWQARAEGSLFETYRLLRRINPSPYLFYFSSDDLEIAGASPETLVRSRHGVAETFPLAGTRPRGGTPAEDQALAAELLADPKELAEHNMLVDLGRNDLGKIARFGSVAVTDYLSVLRYSHVMHLGSCVQARLADGVSPTDVIGAVLPAGTLSGAPKIRACQIIDELEGVKRGVYGGALGYISFSGELDTCIAIRIAYKLQDQVFVRSGAGIVADSVPRLEYQECANKAAAVMTALRQASRGMDSATSLRCAQNDDGSLRSAVSEVGL